MLIRGSKHQNVCRTVSLCRVFVACIYSDCRLWHSAIWLATRI